MIFTSIVAAGLAAVTGMTTIRTPGGFQQVDTNPDFVCEVTSLEFSNIRKDLLRYQDLKDSSFPRPGKGKGDNSAVSQYGPLCLVFDYLIDNEILPTSMYCCRAYAVDNNGNHVTNENFRECAFFQFNDEYGPLVSFTEDEIVAMDANHSFFAHNPRLNLFPNVEPYDLVLDTTLETIQLRSAEYSKVFAESVDVTADFELIEHQDHMETTFGPGTGGYSTHCLPPGLACIIGAIIDCILYWMRTHPFDYTEIDLGNQINAIHDGIVNGECQAATWIGDTLYAGSPLTASYFEMSLEQSDIIHGIKYLNANDVTTNIRSAMNVTYGEMVSASNIG